MSIKPLVLRERALKDIEDAIDFYARDAGEKIALAFIDALERAYNAIARQPAIGSPRYSYELDIPGLRCWRLKRFPYLIFYAESTDSIDIWRVLHAKRDIPAWMQEP
jgi:toxin ParE1/3/4